jgi:hypothetical protein
MAAAQRTASVPESDQDAGPVLVQAKVVSRVVGFGHLAAA